MYQHLTLSTLALIGDPGPVPPELFGLADESLADISAAICPAPAPYGGTGFWPVVPTEPAYDPATQRLGTLIQKAPDPKTRTVPATYVVEALPPPPPPSAISTRQFFQQLAKDGDCTEAEALAYVQTGALPKVLSDVINTLPALIRFDVKMEVIGANEFNRTDPTVDMVGYLLGKDAAALDRIWRFASAL